MISAVRAAFDKWQQRQLGGHATFFNLFEDVVKVERGFVKNPPRQIGALGRTRPLRLRAPARCLAPELRSLGAGVPGDLAAGAGVQGTAMATIAGSSGRVIAAKRPLLSGRRHQLSVSSASSARICRVGTSNVVAQPAMTKQKPRVTRSLEHPMTDGPWRGMAGQSATSRLRAVGWTLRAAFEAGYFYITGSSGNARKTDAKI